VDAKTIPLKLYWYQLSELTRRIAEQRENKILDLVRDYKPKKEPRIVGNELVFDNE